jgi:hypothetical protein
MITVWGFFLLPNAGEADRTSNNAKPKKRFTCISSNASRIFSVA